MNIDSVFGVRVHLAAELIDLGNNVGVYHVEGGGVALRNGDMTGFDKNEVGLCLWIMVAGLLCSTGCTCLTILILSGSKVLNFSLKIIWGGCLFGVISNSWRICQAIFCASIQLIMTRILLITNAQSTMDKVWLARVVNN